MHTQNVEHSNESAEKKNIPHLTQPDSPEISKRQEEKAAQNRRAGGLTSLRLTCWPASRSAPAPHQQRRFRPISKTEAAISVLCSIFWAAVLLSALAVLVLHALFGPATTPQFGLSQASLDSLHLGKSNATSSLLYANLSLTASFANPSHVAGVGIEFISLEVYFGKTLLEERALDEPITVPRAQSRGTAELRVVSRGVRLYRLEIARLAMINATVAMEVKSSFLARSRLLGNSFWARSLCTVRMRKPPHGSLVSSHCATRKCARKC